MGILSGFDRVLFRGTLRSISYVDGLDKFLSTAGMVTGEQIAARLGVGRTTIGKLRHQSPPVPPAKHQQSVLLREVQYENRSFGFDVLACPRGSSRPGRLGWRYVGAHPLFLTGS